MTIAGRFHHFPKFRAPHTEPELDAGVPSVLTAVVAGEYETCSTTRLITATNSSQQAASRPSLPPTPPFFFFACFHSSLAFSVTRSTFQAETEGGEQMSGTWRELPIISSRPRSPRRRPPPRLH